MRLRKRLLYDTYGDKRWQKALALLMFLKSKAGTTQRIANFSYNKIRKISGLSSTTIKKHFEILKQNGLIAFEGKAKDILVLKGISSRKAHRNIEAKKIVGKTFKDTYHALRAVLFLNLQARKMFVKRMLRIAHNPRKGENFKKAKKFCKHYANSNKFNELGISYKTIGKKVGFCARTAENIVKFALNKRWCRKETHYQATYLPGVNFKWVEGYKFTTYNYGWNIMANTYKLTRYWTGNL